MCTTLARTLMFIDPFVLSLSPLSSLTPLVSVTPSLSSSASRHSRTSSPTGKGASLTSTAAENRKLRHKPFKTVGDRTPTVRAHGSIEPPHGDRSVPGDTRNPVRLAALRRRQRHRSGERLRSVRVLGLVPGGGRRVPRGRQVGGGGVGHLVVADAPREVAVVGGEARQGPPGVRSDEPDDPRLLLPVGGDRHVGLGGDRRRGGFLPSSPELHFGGVFDRRPLGWRRSGSLWGANGDACGSVRGIYQTAGAVRVTVFD